MSSQNIYEGNNSSKSLLSKNSNSNKKLKDSLSSNLEGKKSKQTSISSNTDDGMITHSISCAEPELMDNYNKKENESLSVIDNTSYYEEENRHYSNMPIRNFYNDICIPLNKISGAKNLDEFYKINYKKFQEFCDKPNKLNSIRFQNSELDNLRKRRSNYVRISNMNHFCQSINNNNMSINAKNVEDNMIKVKNEIKFAETIRPERILFYCKGNGIGNGNGNELTNFIQHVNSFQSLKPIGNELISETMEKSFFWIDVLNPTKEEIAVLSDVFGIHPLTVEDIGDDEVNTEYKDNREKLESFLNYYYLCVNSFEEDDYSEIHPVNVSILVFKNCVLSFHLRPLPHTEHVLRRIVQLSKYDFKVNGDWIAYAHIDDIADSFIPYLNSVEIDVNTIDELVLILKESEKNDMLRRIGLSRKHVTAFLRLLNDKSEVIKSLIKLISTLNPQSENLLYLRDVQDHVSSMVKNLNHYDQTLTRAHSNYLAQISIEITLATNDTNDVANKLSVLGAVFLPLSLISGMWGMNVIVPGQAYDSLAPFGIICIVMLAIALVSIYLSKRFGWI